MIILNCLETQDPAVMILGEPIAKACNFLSSTFMTEKVIPTRFWMILKVRHHGWSLCTEVNLHGRG